MLPACLSAAPPSPAHSLSPAHALSRFPRHLLLPDTAAPRASRRGAEVRFSLYARMRAIPAWVFVSSSFSSAPVSPPPPRRRCTLTCSFFTTSSRLIRFPLYSRPTASHRSCALLRSYDPLTTPQYDSIHSALWRKATPARIERILAERGARDRPALVAELRTKRNAYGDLAIHAAIRRSHSEVRLRCHLRHPQLLQRPLLRRVRLV